MPVLVPHRSPPAGPWSDVTSWDVASAADVTRVRRLARGAVEGAGPAPVAADQSFLTSAAARLELALSELLGNGVRHGRPPVAVTVARGDGGWLVSVADGAVTVAPVVPEGRGGDSGGLGLRLVMAMAESVGWYRDGSVKHVWAVIGNEAPVGLVADLTARRSDRAG